MNIPCSLHYGRDEIGYYTGKIPTNQENWSSVGTIASTLAQYSAIYENTLGQFFWIAGMLLLRSCDAEVNY